MSELDKGSIGDSTVLDLPEVGTPDVPGNLSSFINTLRTEAINTRGEFTGTHPESINLYLYGNVTNSDQPHVYPKIQGMINAKVAAAARNVPNLVLKSASLGDGGPAVMTTGMQPKDLDSDAITEFIQHAIDRLLVRSGFKSFYRRMAFYGSLFGWQDALIDSDDIKKNLILRILPAQQWYKDSTTEFLEEMAYVGVDWPIDASIAKRLYPNLRAKIDENATRAIQFAPSASGYSDVFVGQVYARPIVTLSIWYLRNREMPMTPDEATTSGLVQIQNMAVPSVSPTPQPNEPSGENDTGKPADGPASEPSAGPSDGGLPDESGNQQPTPQVPPPATRQAMIHTHTGTEVTPDHELWPRKLVTSQTIQIMNEVVEDKECPWPDIPVVSTFNVKIPNRPYGQSDTIRVKSSQIDVNRVNGNMVRHSEWFKGPVIVMPKSVEASLPAEVRNSGMKPSQMLFIEDRALKQLLDLYQGKPIGWFDPPPLPPALLEMKRELDSNFDVSGGRPQVSQGNSPTSNSSGKLAKVLLDAANQQNDYTTMELELMCERLGYMALDYVLRVWTPEDHLKVNRTYDPMTVELILNTAKEMEWEVESAPANMQQAKEAQARSDFQLQLIDGETARDILHYDNAQVEARLQQQQAEAAAVAAPNQAPQQLQGKPPQGNPRVQSQSAGS